MINNIAQYLVNGEPAESVSVSDRGLHYGDGVFETIAVREGRPCYWLRHRQRLVEGCRRLGLVVPDETVLQRDYRRLCGGVSKAVLKIIITRGPGGHGYRPASQPVSTRIVGMLPWPDFPAQYAGNGIAVRLCTTRLGSNPALAGIKHLNRLEQVLASQEWDDGEFTEGLMMDLQDNIVEGTRTNVFLVTGSRLYTPDLAQCGVAGVMRAVVLDLAARLGVPCDICSVDRERLLQADEVFITNSLIGLWPVRRLEQHDYNIGPITRRLMASLPDCPA